MAAIKKQQNGGHQEATKWRPSRSNKMEAISIQHTPFLRVKEVSWLAILNLRKPKVVIRQQSILEQKVWYSIINKFLENPYRFA